VPSELTVIPQTMKAAVWRGDPDPANMAIETLQTPAPLRGEVLVKVKACGVCHTDLHVIKGEVPFPQPGVLGHEISGLVVSLGPGASEALLGQKVMCPFIMPCGGCYFCQRGEEDTCEPFFALNRGKGQLYDDVSEMPYRGSTRLCTLEGEEVAMYSMAGLAEYCVVPTSAVFILPPRLGESLFAESAILGCMFFTAYGSVHNAAKLQPGETAAVIGCGGVGSAVIQIASDLGASTIIAVDIGDEKLEQARQNGATHTVDALDPDVPARIAEITGGRKVDVCFEAIGLKKTFETSLMSVRDGGRAVYVGIADVKTKAEVPITHVVRRRVSLVGSYGSRASKDVPALLRLADDDKVNISDPISRRFTLHAAGEAYSLLKEGKILGRAIVDIGEW